MKYSLLFFCIEMLGACQSPDAPSQLPQPVDSAKAIENKVMIPKSSCYVSIRNQDTVRLKVEVFPNVVTGVLSYALHEKDRSHGEYDGHLKGDTLLADYTFQSEGRSSVRQVAFLISDSMAVEGYGDMKDENGKMVFTDPGKLTFGQGITLKKTYCD